LLDALTLSGHDAYDLARSLAFLIVALSAISLPFLSARIAFLLFRRDR
jgi:hypothetical protein